MNETGLEIAIIGMAGRFPGAENIHEFWNNLKNGIESITFFSGQELQDAGISAKEIENPDYIKANGVLADVEYFDPAFFNFTPGEAEMMDPQLRLFLECSWHALEDAGYDPGSFNGAVGVYAGNSTNHYWIAKTMFNKKYYLFGRFKADLLNTHFSTRASYHLNLRGPGLTIQTACSTSLVTIHTACLALLSSECDMALAGGVSIVLPQVDGYRYQEGMVASPDGHCRAFDARAKGTISGSGAGVVVLKRLEDALADNDFIYALVKGTALNNDGLRKVGYTAPSVEGQAEAIRAAYIMAEIEPETIGYIETHGTGTELGDPVEIEALNMVFKNNEKQSIPIGSVKSNVGHLDAASGVTGFIKTVLALKHRQIPPSLHFETPNPKIGVEHTPFYVNNRLIDWESAGTGGHPLRAGISSFGLGGTNAHAVLEEWPGDRGVEPGGEPLCSPEDHREYQLILLSARTKTALERQTENVVEFLKSNPGINLDDVAYTLQVGRKPFKSRRTALCSTSDLNEAIELLSKPGGSKRVRTFYSRADQRPVIFLISGQGSQYVNMGLDLYGKEKYFREVLDHCFDIVKPIVGRDLKDILYPPDHSSGKGNEETEPETGIEPINETEITQPIVFSFEYALAKLLMKWGIKPTAMIGYSMGEYIAACLSGVFSLEDALKLVTIRGQLMKKTADAAMLSVPLPEEEVKPLLAGNNDVSLAIVNGPSCIVAGRTEAVETFGNQMKEKRLMCAPVNLSHAVHSPLMNSIREEYEKRVGEVTLNTPDIPYISNVSGQWITPQEAADPAYWGKHLCNTVRFADGIKELLKQENAVFIEIGPGRVLSNILRQLAPPDKKPGQKEKAVNVIKHHQEKVGDDLYLLSRLGELWLYGIPVDWPEVYGEEKQERRRIPLPLYPFDRKRYWIDEELSLGDGVEIGELLSRQRETAVEEPLPEPVPGQYESDEDYGWGDEYEEEYEAPRDELEENIAGVWQDFLGFERISIHANFFEINGDSLTATQLITRLQHIYPVEISLQSFFEEPTIAHLAEVIKELLVEKVKGLSEEELEKLTEQ